MQTPYREINYRDRLRGHEQSSDHILSLRDEGQLADHIAFLAHTREGSSRITALCVEERPNGQESWIRLGNTYDHLKWRR